MASDATPGAADVVGDSDSDTVRSRETHISYNLCVYLLNCCLTASASISG